MSFFDRGNAKKVIYVATYDAHENLVEICRSTKRWSRYIYYASFYHQLPHGTISKKK